MAPFRIHIKAMRIRNPEKSLFVCTQDTRRRKVFLFNSAEKLFKYRYPTVLKYVTFIGVSRKKLLEIS
jgi:hypothetical protein